jgi:hypothetical protein
MFLSILGLSVAAMIVLFIASTQAIDFTQSPWPFIAILPLIGFPIAILLIIVRLVVSAVRRVRDARDA